MSITRILANRKTFSAWQALGLHIVRAKYDSPIPDTRELSDRTWSSRSDMIGIDLRGNEQLELLSTYANSFASEYTSFPRETSSDGLFFLNNPYFGTVDAEALYCFVRSRKPARIVEIGSGFSTLLSAQALVKNSEEGNKMGEIIAIEPYPKQFLRKGIPGMTKLITDRVQSIPFELFEGLEPNDILFIDSSHVAKTGSDVCFEINEILPRLRPGVVVHIHDIFFPADYPRRQVMDLKIFYNEQYLLQAFLAFNEAFRVVWSSSYLHLRHPGALELAFPSYDARRHWPGSFWMERVR